MSRLSVPALLCLLLAGPVAAQTPSSSRLDPALRLLQLGLVPGAVAEAPVPTDSTPRRSLLAPAPYPLFTPRAAVRGGDAAIRVVARLGPGGEAALLRQGGRIAARAGDIVTARIPAHALAALVSEPGIEYLEAASWLELGAWTASGLWSRSLDGGAHSLYGGVQESDPGERAPLPPRPERVSEDAHGFADGAGRGSRGAGTVPAPANDTGSAEAGVAALRSRSGDRFHGLTGQGVIIGLIDTGLDLSHADFRDAEGRTRVLWAWDQTVESGRPPGTVGEHVLEYGHECTRAEIDAGDCPLRDLIGHGTHVAGIAAGDGSATGHGLPAYRYTGVAPMADLIVVRAGDTGFTSDRLIEGVAYIFRRAAELGRPVVVNLSVTTQSGPHDGTTNLERALSALAGPGRILVAGVGNDGMNANESPAFARAAKHASGTLGRGAESSHALVVPPYTPRPGASNDGALLELWYAGADSIEVALTSPNGYTLRVATGDSAIVSTPDGSLGILNGAGGTQAVNGDHVAMLAIADLEADSPPAAGRWTITLRRTGGRGDGRYHLWLVGGAFDHPTELASLEGATSNSHLVGSPATADRVLAVAGYTTKHEWRTVGGEPQEFLSKEPLGDIAFFSSPGPRRDGVLKPDIAAPAKVVISARASEGRTWEEVPWLVEEDGVHAALFGTSMSAPYVAGVVALLLQLDPRLGPEQVRELLAATARRDDFTRNTYTGEAPGTPNAQWGHGKLDAARAVRSLSTGGRVLEGRRINLSQNPVRSERLVINYGERPRSIVVYALTGERVRRLDGPLLEPFAAVWDLRTDRGRPVANGAYVVAVEFDGDRILEKIFVLRP